MCGGKQAGEGFCGAGRRRGRRKRSPDWIGGAVAGGERRCGSLPGLINGDRDKSNGK
jgi:hypothetical protein